MQGLTLNFIFVAETADSQSVAVHKAIKGNRLVSFCELYKDTFKGKNAELDAKIQQYL